MELLNGFNRQVHYQWGIPNCNVWLPPQNRDWASGYITRCRYSYMAIDLKVLARSLNCESMCMLCWKPSHFFFELAFFYSRKFCDSWILWIIIIALYTLQLAKGYHLLSPRTFTFRFIGSSQASEGEASPQPNTMVLKHVLARVAGTA